MKIFHKAAAMALATALLSNGVAAAKLYKCINESGETTYRQTACVNAEQEEILQHKSKNQKGDAHNGELPENRKDDAKYMADIRKRLDAYGERALQRQKSSPEEAIKGRQPRTAGSNFRAAKSPGTCAGSRIARPGFAKLLASLPG